MRDSGPQFFPEACVPRLRRGAAAQEALDVRRGRLAARRIKLRRMLELRVLDVQKIEAEFRVASSGFRVGGRVLDVQTITTKSGI